MLITWMVLKPAVLLSSQGHQEYSNENTPFMTFHYFKKSLLSAYYVIVSVLGSWNTSVNTHKYPYSLGVSVQFSHVWLFVTPWTAACQASLSITNSWSPPKLMSIESVMSSNHLILCHPLLLLPSIFPSIRVFSNESALCIRWPKFGSFSFNISPTNEHPGLIFRVDWLDLLAVQGTLKCLLQHHSSKASILQGSALFIVQLSHPYMTIGKTICCTTFKRSEKPVLYVIIDLIIIIWSLISCFASLHFLGCEAGI